MATGRGACASGDPHSALAGRSALLEGGNAVDAAVAAGLMASFTMPPMTGLGGAGLMTIRLGDEVTVADFFTNVPGLGDDGRARPAPDVVKVPFEDVIETFLVGTPTVGVPGVVKGLWEVHARYGRMPLGELVGLVVEAARRGVEVQDAQYKGFVLLQSIFRRDERAWALVGDEDGLLGIGERMKNDALADTLAHLAEEGPRAFYEGEVAHAIVDATDGLLTRRDLQTYEVVWREPLKGSYRGHDLQLPAIPSLSGGMILTSLVDLERGDPLPWRGRTRKEWWRLADALRRGEALRTKDYESAIFREGYLQGIAAACRAGSTLHCSTIDGDGNAVSYTSSMGETAGLTAGRHGFALNNFLGEPDILPRGDRNRAGFRMMTSMCPMLAVDPSGRWLALGSAGGNRIRSAILQVLLHLIDGKRTIREAIGRPRIHLQGDKFYVEGYGRTREQVEAFRPYGLELVQTWAPGFFFGGVQAVRDVDGTRYEGGADHVRRGGAAYVV